MSLFGNVELFGKGTVGSIDATVTDIRWNVDSGTAVRFVSVTEPAAVMVVAVPAEFGTARGTKP